jgi:UDPglucose 6-dehydrogenase
VAQVTAAAGSPVAQVTTTAGSPAAQVTVASVEVTVASVEVTVASVEVTVASVEVTEGSATASFPAATCHLPFDSRSAARCSQLIAATYTSGMRCTIFGTGYLGATHAAGMAELGHEVVGVDIDPGKVAKLASGDIPFYEPGLRKMLTDNLAAGRLHFTTDYDMAAEFADVHFLGVGTPQKKGEYGADLRHIHAVIDTLVPRLTRSSVLIGKSTVPVGTAADLATRAAALAHPGVDVEVAWNPEFLREGFAVHDTLHPDRIVLGVQDDSKRAEAAARELYGPLLGAGVPFMVTDLQTAELVKVSANAFLATKISFINAVSEVCEAAGADVSLLADALGYDPRIGRQCLNAGLGFGGGCLPKDIRAFMARAGELGADQALTFLREVDSINMRRRTKMVELATTACGGSILGANIAVLGAAFKPESDDVRDSPALNVAGQLQLNGATVNVYDPKALENARRQFPTLNYAVSVTDACERADAVLVLTEWREFVDLDPDDLADWVRARVVVDGRNCLNVARWQQAGWRVYRLGARRP